MFMAVTALRPEEKIIGCVRRPLTFGQSSAVVVINDYLHLSTDSPDVPSWRDFLARIPRPFRLATDRVCIPLADVVGPVEVLAQARAHD